MQCQLIVRVFRIDRTQLTAFKLTNIILICRNIQGVLKFLALVSPVQDFCYTCCFASFLEMSWAFGLGLGCCLVNVTTGRICDMTAVERFIIKQLLMSPPPPMNDGIAYPVAGGQLINRSIYCFLFEMQTMQMQ